MEPEDYMDEINNFSACGCVEIWEKISEIRDESPNP